MKLVSARGFSRFVCPDLIGKPCRELEEGKDRPVGK